MNLPPMISARQVLERYDVLLLDLWGVLIDAKAALPHASAFIDHLNRSGKTYFAITNGSTYDAKASSENLEKKGVFIDASRIITSGSLVVDWLKENTEAKKNFIILGPDAATYMTREAGHNRIPLESEDADGVIIANQVGYDLLFGIDHILSLAIRKFENDEPFTMLLGNPDLMYVAGEGQYGITCGMIALTIERALELRFGEGAPKFLKLGKPYSPIFAEAKRRAGFAKSMVMIGDQIETDIRGAKNAQIDSVLLGTGVSPIDLPKTYQMLSPDFRMYDLSLSL